MKVERMETTVSNPTRHQPLAQRRTHNRRRRQPPIPNPNLAACQTIGIAWLPGKRPISILLTATMKPRLSGLRTAVVMTSQRRYRWNLVSPLSCVSIVSPVTRTHVVSAAISYPSEDDPENDDFVWDDCGFTLRFQATADINDLTDLPDQSYLYRTGKTNSSGEACLALNLDFLKFTFGEGEGATDRIICFQYFRIKASKQFVSDFSKRRSFIHRNGRRWILRYRFYILNKTTAEMKQKISVTIQADPQVILDEMTADLAGVSHQ